MRKLTPQQRDDVAALYLNGKSSSEIALRFGCSPENVQMLLKRRGIVMRRSAGKNSGFFRGGPRAERTARFKVYRAIKAGVLAKGPCEICGTTENIRAHHDDYEKPLSVRWLCQKHHHQWHRRNTAKAVAHA